MSNLRVDDPAVKQWHRVCGRLREEVGDAAYQSWVKPMTLGGIADGQVHLAVPTRFLRDWVNTHYAERIRALWAGENPEVRTVKVDVAKTSTARAPVRRVTPAEPMERPQPRVVESAAPAKAPRVVKAAVKAVEAEPAPVVKAPRIRKAAVKAVEVEPAPVAKAPRIRKAAVKAVEVEPAPVVKAPRTRKAAVKAVEAEPAPVVKAPRTRKAAVKAVEAELAPVVKAPRTRKAPAKAAPQPEPEPIVAPVKAVRKKAAPVVAVASPVTPNSKASAVKAAAAPKTPATAAKKAPTRKTIKAAPQPDPESFLAAPSFEEDDFAYAEAAFAAPDFDDLPAAPAAPFLPAGGVSATVVSDAVDDGLSAPLDPRYTFENFVTGKPNEFAYAAAQRVADSDRVAFNPLFLYGGVGLGKTHLMHAIAWAIRERHPGRRVVYLSAEKFMYSFVKALRYKTTMDFKEQFRSVDVLMIDDVQFISGKDSTQEEFFHTFNALVDQGRQIVISADKSPADLEDIGDRLRSRLASGLVADIHPTTYELRLGILAAKAEQMGTLVPTKVLEFLAHKISSNVRELEGALTRLIAHAQLVGRELSLETAQDVLRDVLRANDRRITIEDIQKKVAEHFQIRLSDMGSARRSRSVARPRQVAMYLSKQLTSRSLPEIGRKFGGRDHTTVMHAVKKVEELMGSDDSFSEDVDLLRRMLEA